jgi:hypothetical protein
MSGICQGTAPQPRPLPATHAVTSGHQRSVVHLRVPRLNLALLHWPAAARIPPSDPRNAQLRLESWRALVVAQGMGLVRIPSPPRIPRVVRVLTDPPTLRSPASACRISLPITCSTLPPPLPSCLPSIRSSCTPCGSSRTASPAARAGGLVFSCRGPPPPPPPPSPHVLMPGVLVIRPRVASATR